MEKFAPWNRQGSRARSSMSKTCVMADDIGHCPEHRKDISG
jgi:hypothetical protein